MCVCVCVCVCVQPRLILCNAINCSLPDSSVCGISQTRIQEWVAISFSKGSFQPRNRTWVSCVCCIVRQILYHCTIWEIQNMKSVQFSSFQSLSRVQLFATPWISACQASLSITNSWSSLRLTSIESVMPFSHLILCHPLLLLPLIPPSIRVFLNESTLRMR